MSKFSYHLLVGIFVASLLMLLFGVLCWTMPMMSMHPWFSRHLLIRVGIPSLVIVATLREGLLTAKLNAKFKLSRDETILTYLRSIAVDLGIDAQLIHLVGHPSSVAFCTGMRHPIILISTGLIEHLSLKQIKAVLLHEYYHCLRRDPLRILLVDVVRVALFFLPAIHEWHGAFKAQLEVEADEYAVRKVGKAALAGALHRLLAETAYPAPVSGAIAGLSINALRVANLLGDRSIPQPVSRRSLVISTLILWAICWLMI